MKKNFLANLFLSFCLATSLNVCNAEKNYDEEITLPVGENFDLEMEEITRYEYDGNYVKAQTVNNKEQLILQKQGDTIITLVMKDQEPIKVLVHIVSKQQFNGGNSTPASNPTTPATAPTNTAQVTKENNDIKVATTTTPVAQPSKPAATAAPATKTETTKPQTQAPAPATQSQVQKPATAPIPAKPQQAAQAQEQKTTTPPATATQSAEPVTIAPAPKPSLEALQTAQTITRPAKPNKQLNSIEAVQYKAVQFAFDILDLVNAEREKNGIRKLSMAKDLKDEANIRCKELPVRFTHTRPDNTKFTTVMSNLGSLQAENIAAGQTTPAAVFRAWMNSSKHRENILNPDFTEIGIGYYAAIKAEYACYWTQLFRG